LPKTTDVVRLRVTAHRLGVRRFRLALLMIVSYLSMMTFLIYSARNAPQSSVVATDFGPAVIALASCMAFSVVLTGFFVFVRNRD
jgi:hypothetical protein